MRFFLVTLVLFFVMSVHAQARDEIWVGSDQKTTQLAKAISSSREGDIIKLTAGRYDAQDLKIYHDLTLIGIGEVIIYAPHKVRQGLIVRQSGTNIVIENLIFEQASSPDQNGAGIRFEGMSLDVRGTTFRENENGILATGDRESRVTISNSIFEDNGYGDGYSHGIYMSHGAELVVQNSVFKGTKIGHHIKSVTRERTIVIGSDFDDEQGRTSYIVDVTGGGNVRVSDNKVVRSKTADQSTLVNYDTTRGGQAGEILLFGNSILSFKKGVRMLRNPERANVREGNNLVDLKNGLPVSLPKSTISRGLEKRTMRDGRPYTQSTGANIQSRLIDQVLEREKGAVRESGRGLITAPFFEVAEGPSDIVGLGFERKKQIKSRNHIVTFGHPFRKGDVDASEALQLKIGEMILPVQMDVKALHTDKSIRHAILSVNLEQLKSVGNKSAILQERTVESAPNASLKFDKLNNYTLEIDGGGHRKKVSLKNIISGANLGELWMSGDLVREESHLIEISPFLVLRLDLRTQENGHERMRLTFENHSSFKDGSRDLNYSVQVTDGDQEILKEQNIFHYRGSNWSKVIWRGSEPAYDVFHDPSYLRDSKAIPYFDLVTPVSKTAIISDVRVLQPATGLFDEGLLTKYFPTSGGRDELGLLPQWDVRWIKSQSPQAKAVMMRMAERAGAVPWHFSDDKKHLPVRLDERPKFWADDRGESLEYAPDNISKDYFRSNGNGWSLDNAHKPLLSYTAYLVSGDAYFARELSHEAAFAMAVVWPALRQGGLLVVEDIQVRSRAWSLRDIAAASWILPDSDSLKEYFVIALEENISYLHKQYVEDRSMRLAGELEGWFEEHVNGEPGRISPWQNDYLIMVLGQEALRGNNRAKALIKWASNYHISRFLHAESDPAIAPAAVHVARDPESGRAYDEWQEMVAATRAYSDDLPVYLDYAAGYVASAYASLMTIYSVTNDPRALRAVEVLTETFATDGLYQRDNPGSIYSMPSFWMSTIDENGEFYSIAPH